MLITLKITIIFVIANLLFIVELHANDTLFVANEKMALNIRSGAAYNFYNSNIINLPGSRECGLFTKGNGIGYSIGVVPEKRLNEWINIGIGLSYTDRSGALVNDGTLPIRDGNTGNIIDLQIENRIESNLSFFEISPEINTTLYEDLFNGPLKIFGGFRISIPVRHSFIQKEVIVSPEDKVFEHNQKRSREIAKGDILNINPLQYGMSIGLENMLKVGKSDYLTQQISFDYNINSMLKDMKWHVFAVRFEIGYRFAFIDEEIVVIEDSAEEIDSVIVKEEIEVKEPFLSIEYSDTKGGLYISQGNELLATLPLVNSIFFARNSAQLPDKYIKDKFDLPSLYHGDAVDQSKYILQRIAGIVNKNPDALIDIYGFTAGSDIEKEGLELAKNRAISCKEALMGIGIPDSIMKISYEIEPFAASNKDYAEGIAENQRAEIIIHNAPLQEYVGVQKYAELNGEIDIIIDFKNLPEKNEVILEPFFYDTLIVCSQPGIYTIPVKYRLDGDNEKAILSAEVSYRNIIKDQEIKIETDKLNSVQKELLLSNFRAVLRFDYNSSELSSDNKQLLQQLAKVIPNDAKIIISGSADALGTERQNIQLANQRASTARDYLKNEVKFGNEININNNFKKFSETAPEGRFLNRSISIEIK